MLQSDDFEVGMLITVVQSNIPKTEDNGFVFVKVQSNDTTYQGAVLEIKAIMLPYIVVKEKVSKHGDDPYSNKAFSLDTRIYKFMKVTEEYANALGKEKK